MKERTRKHGLTLVEVLVSIAIVIILSGIIFSATRFAIRSAKNSTCASNLKNLYHGASLYAADFDGYQPHYSPSWPDSESAKWKPAMMQYVKADEVFYCPLDHLAKTSHLMFGGASSLHTSYWGTYNELKYRESIDEPPYKRPESLRLSFATAAEPSNEIYLADRVEELVVNEYVPGMITHRHQGHGDQFNAVYMDGHIQKVPMTGRVVESSAD